LEARYRSEVSPLVRDLVQLGGDPDHATRTALALVREGANADVDPRLLLAVVAVENPWLEPGARSPSGAVGLMQVMPFHAGAWGCGSSDLTDLEVNICHGTNILADAIRRQDGDLRRALLRYNGCVRGTDTPDCHLIPPAFSGTPARPTRASGRGRRR
jgi:soluble lytic murein transglycosylase-like protein